MIWDQLINRDHSPQRQGYTPAFYVIKTSTKKKSTLDMTFIMTSHATIENSTFVEPRSADTIMSSIDGPSDFTENMFNYMKGQKKTTIKKSPISILTLNQNANIIFSLKSLELSSKVHLSLMMISLTT
jgi:hypothetical protein